ncbi:N-acetyl-gamma-glutamyl-phosphate reductase [BD1-7 clade bacterium]|uniref:N-acetyl-gamma-glutamyl-phosphate reductase n=1 Tax=BD1-7 clade bacterium TaxID=2029982 RepID=A0A5S9QAS7_9GAMM|nr:N-acetyl-gamma-glutamyl-phosphate reductase [BD1-7 clade bacterium]
MIRAAIVGGTGYTGVELLRLLANHPQVDLAVITSRSEAGMPVADMFPSLRGRVDLCFTEPDTKTLAACDVVFFATPHAVAMKSMDELLQHDVRVVDLSADFRVKDIPLWESWYGCKHEAPHWVDKAVYGLPEINREAMRTAQLVAAPGCYPTAVQLGYLPLLEAGIINPSDLIANCASGVSGAGKAAKVTSLYAECNEDFKAYGVPGHRHLPEIEQGLNGMTAEGVNLTFVPHLIPMTRGIHATLYATLTVDPSYDLQALFEQRYADEPYVDVLPAGSVPQTRTVRGSNYCRIAVERPQGRDKVVVMTAIDNLVKGASGQAIQAMNIMFGLDECAGLNVVPLSP